MCENDAKGWYGSYSIAGRESAEKYHIIIHKDEILDNENKKMKIKDVFNPDEPQHIESLDEKLDIFKAYEDKNNKISEILTSKKNKNKLLKNDKYKYHNKHIEEGKKIKKVCEPACTRYYPKYEYIWPKLITGPSWKKSMGRNLNNKEIDNKEFFHEDITFSPTSKCLVNMNKTTQRGEFNVSNNVRIRTDKPFTKDPLSEKLKSKKKKKTLTNNIKNNNRVKSLNDLDFENISTINNDQNKRNKSILLSKKEINAPDFQKTISREQREKVKSIKINPIPYIFPNYSLVRDRILTITVYEKPKKHIPRIKIIQGFDSGITYQPDIAINKIDNHSEPKVPNFKLMTSRNNKKYSKLPTYMQNVHDRKSVNVITEKSLKLSNYKNGKFMNASTSFFPKKSFNNIINLNILKSENFISEKNKDEVIEKEKENLKSSLNFFHKNYDELIKEGALNKFDNITLKTIQQRKKLDLNDLKKFIINFDNIDEEIKNNNKTKNIHNT